MNNEVSKQDPVLAAPGQDKQNSQEKKGFIGIFLLGIMSLLVIVSIAASIYLWQQLQHLSSDLVKNSVYQLDVERDQHDKNTQQKELNLLVEKVTAQAQIIEELDNQQDQVNIKLSKVSGVNRNDWLLDELQHLTRLAHQRLVLSLDAQGAIALLQAADRVVIEMRSTDTLPVREAIASDLIQLKVAANTDLEGAYILLSSLSNKVDSLSLIQPSFPASTQGKSVELLSGSKASSKTQFDAAIDNVLNKIEPYLFRTFTIEDEVKPLLDKQDKKYLVQNINLLIAQAQLALLRREPESYRLSIEQSQDWLKKYFDTSEPMVISMLGVFDELKAYQLNPILPEINMTLDAVNDLLEGIQNKKISQGGTQGEK